MLSTTYGVNRQYKRLQWPITPPKKIVNACIVSSIGYMSRFADQLEVLPC